LVLIKNRQNSYLQAAILRLGQELFVEAGLIRKHQFGSGASAHYECTLGSEVVRIAPSFNALNCVHGFENVWF
jgi:hypothetical protein